jgi:hypothetical protein
MKASNYVVWLIVSGVLPTLVFACGFLAWQFILDWAERRGWK